jgi:uncharacterized protein with HEPN domain
MRYDATLRNLELIGEAATHVPDAVRRAAADVVVDDLVPLRAAFVRLLAAHT